ncbi:MAG TPA: hypothetical protein VG652_02140 [Gaiellaceae bacterium]|nr:hypothetical protein [Gaiellaceae bacterium]
MRMIASHHVRGAALAAGVAALGLAAAGCGGGAKTPAVANLGTTSTPSTTTSPAAGGAVGDTGAQASSSGGGGTLRMVGGSVQELTKLSACMRKNGVPNFPDPNAQGEISITGIDPGSASFQQAQQACRKLLPNGGTPSPAQQAQARAQALAFSACMRKNGVPSFPDPQFGSGGRISIKIGRGQGIDPSLPQFQAAQKACQKDIPGKFGAPVGGAAKSSDG